MMEFAERLRLFRLHSPNWDAVHPDPVLCFCGHRRDAHNGLGLAGARPMKSRCRHCQCPYYARAKEES